MRTILFCATFCVLLSAACAGDDAPRTFQSVSARNAQNRYRNDLADATRKLDAQSGSARDAYLRILKTSLAGETKAGNLAEANRIQAEIEELGSAASATTKGSAAKAKPTAPSGKFRLQFPGGNEQIFDFDGKGGATIFADGRTIKGKVFQKGDHWYVDEGDRDTNRITIAGNRIFVEHWRQEQKGNPHTLGSGFAAE